MRPFLNMTLIAISLGVAACETQPDRIFAPLSASQIPLDRDTLRAIKDSVRSKLKDPDSAEFGTITLYRDAVEGEFACGTVNAKNSYGGYVGYAPFFSSITNANGLIVAGAQLQASQDYSGVTVFAQLFPKCAQ